ncbi:MAG: hypothetical protein QM790_04250 [Nibricoccus sp.]
MKYKILIMCLTASVFLNAYLFWDARDSRRLLLEHQQHIITLSRQNRELLKLNTDLRDGLANLTTELTRIQKDLHEQTEAISHR